MHMLCITKVCCAFLGVGDGGGGEGGSVEVSLSTACCCQKLSKRFSCASSTLYKKFSCSIFWKIKAWAWDQGSNVLWIMLTGIRLHAIFAIGTYG